MLFCSQNFLLFYLAVFVVYWALPWPRARIGLLLISSFAFYASWNKWLAIIICVTTAADYGIALLMEASSTPRRRKGLLLLSVGMNLALLAYFKYVNFFLSSLEEALTTAGAEVSLPVLSILLPIGISFYTFEAISYTVDVYRGKIRAERNLAHFMLFILFFPHLIAGPIVRAADFLPQIQRRKRWSWGRLNLGLQFFLMGMVKKLVLADRMLAPHVDAVFGDGQSFGTGTLWLATLAWALQVYCDFSGYSDMALGCAHLLGYKLCQNFNMPYLAVNISEFWRRWHMSLGSWLRDYLFIPLGGSRGAFGRTCINLLITMALCGLWHGAAWPFVVFGVMQAALLIVHMAFRGVCRRLPMLDAILQTSVGTALRVAVTFVSFCVTLVIFRAPTLTAGIDMLHAMLVPRPDQIPLTLTTVWVAAGVIAVCHALGYGNYWKRIAARLPAPALGFGHAMALTLTLMLAAGAGRAFVYFQF